MTTIKVKEVISGLDTLTQLDLLKKAAEYKDLSLGGGAPDVSSKPIKAYTLDAKLLTMLAERGIKHHPRADEIFTLVDENPQEKHPGWAPSNYWNFKRPEPSKHALNLRISLHVDLRVDIEKRGVVLWPKAHGTFLSPCDHLPNFRMWKALVESDEDAPAVAKELATCEEGITVMWTELGLGGIRKLSLLFHEFARGNKAVDWIAEHQRIFNPMPYPQYSVGRSPNDDLFVPEPSQPKILEMWREQLDVYRESLRV